MKLISGYNEQQVAYMKRKLSWCKRAVSILASRQFFWFVVGFFVLESGWIALTSNYPMAFDEDYHFGIIRLFADHISPFWSSQPAGADAYGAVVRDPSYIYHYLMSFPYRLISLFTDNLMTQVLCLRAIQISLFACGLVIYRRLLLKTGASSALVQACLLIYVFIPVVPLLAAQINYDSLFIPVVGLILLMTVQFDESLRKRPAGNSKLLLGIITIGLFASLIKYAFLPIFVTILLYLIARLWRKHGSFNEILTYFLADFRKLKRSGKILILSLLSVAVILCGERYGLNLVRYHAPIASCDQVLSIEQCSAYGPWLRDYTLEMQKTGNGDGPHAYMWSWLNGMWIRLFFAVDGPGTHYQTRGPFVIPAMSAVVFAIVGLIVVVRYGRQVFARYHRNVLLLLILVSSVYLTVLWLDGFEAYRRTGKAVAINGRYLLPILPIGFVFVGLAFSVALKQWLRPKLAMVVISVSCLIWGGGALTYILRSNDAWYWPNTPLKSTNHMIQRSLGPLVPGYDMPAQYLR